MVLSKLIVTYRWCGFRYLLITGPAVLATVLFLLSPAAAQTAPDADHAALSARKEALFQQMLRDPGNLDVTFAYASVSAQLGDNEAAVAALERMLLFNPNLPRVDLELGALYYRMKSYDLARTYFQKALAAKPPAEVKERVADYLARIASESSPVQFSGYVLFGAQYQSDANLGPSTSLIQIGSGIPVTLASQFVKQQDFNLLTNGAIQYSLDLGTQDRDTLEIGANTFISHYFEFGRLDLGLLELTVGPRLRFPDLGEPIVKHGTLKPYVIANEVLLGEHQYFWTYGTGIEATAQFPDNIETRTIFEYRQKRFSNAADRPLTTGLTGSDKLVTMQVSKLLSPNSALGAELGYLAQDTAFDFYANKTYSVAANYRVRYHDPTGTVRRPLETAVYASRSWARYDGPDPCCSLVPARRYDRRWRIGITQTVPITDDISLVAQLQRDVVSSNLPIYAYISNSALLAAQIRF